MIGYYIAIMVGFIAGYFVACLMMIAKGNDRIDIDMDVHSWDNE